MDHILGAEEARSMDLPISPFSRHRHVASYIKVVNMLGTEVKVSRPLGTTVEIDGIPIRVLPSGPLLGRRALQHIAEAAGVIDYFTKYGVDMKGEN